MRVPVNLTYIKHNESRDFELFLVFLGIVQNWKAINFVWDNETRAHALDCIGESAAAFALWSLCRT